MSKAGNLFPAVRTKKNVLCMLNFLSSIVSSIMNAEQASETRAQNRENMFIQSELNRQMYDYERNQESPTRMVEAFEAAGLNPALMYGGAGNSLGNATSLSGVTATATAPASPYRITAPSFIELSQKRNIDADTEGKEIDNQTRSVKNLLDLQTKRADISEKLSKVDVNSALAQQYRKSIEEIDAQIALLTQQAKTESTKQDLNKAQTATEGSKKNLYDAKTTTESSKQKNLESDTNLKNIKASRENIALSFENFMRAPVDMFKTVPSIVAYISYAIGNGFLLGFDSVMDVLNDIKQDNNGSYPDPVKDFVLKYWDKFVDYANDLDGKIFNGRTKPLKKIGE